MKTRIGCLAVLASVMGMAAEAAALRENYEGAPGKRGLSLRFPEVSPQEEWGSVPMLSDGKVWDAANDAMFEKRMVL